MNAECVGRTLSQPSSAGRPVALVTGASSGIGREIAVRLFARGWTVYAASRRVVGFDQEGGLSEAHPSGGKMLGVRLDCTDADACAAVVQLIRSREGRLAALVQSAGSGLAGAVEDCSPAEVESQIASLVYGSAWLLPDVLALMREQGSGRIVQISSLAAVLPVPFQAWYSAGKSANRALFLALNGEVRSLGIQCMIVQPGDTRTGFTKARVVCARSATSSYQDRFERSLARMTHDEEHGADPGRIAEAIVRRMLRRRMPEIYTPGLVSRLYVALIRLLPQCLVRGVVNRLYAR